MQVYKPYQDIKNVTGRDLLPVARYWYEQGVIPLPMHWRSKHPAIRWKPWVEQRPGWDEVATAFDVPFKRNIAVLVGAVSNNLVILDFDEPLFYYKWRDLGYHSYTVRTSRGYHVYLYMQQPPLRTLSMGGGEVKASGLVMAAPSRHKSGTVYTVISAPPILSIKNLSSVGISPKVFEALLPKKPPRKQQVKLTDKRSIIAEIKRQLPLATLLSQYTQIEYGNDQWAMCCCPFHDDHTPSMWINLEWQMCKCYKPSCRAHRQYPLDVVNVYSLLTGLRNGDAIRELAAKLVL